jgi:hypothetical protein
MGVSIWRRGVLLASVANGGNPEGCPFGGRTQARLRENRHTRATIDG